MATVIPYKDKDGKIISYQIQVFRGRDGSGKKLKPYTMSWKVPETYKSEKAIQKALEKVVGEFESECKHGMVSFDKRTLQDYIAYYIELKSRDSKTRSIAFYESLLPRINEELGPIQLSNITAEHLNKFYIKLQNCDVRMDKKAIGKESLLDAKRKSKLTHTQIADLSSLSVNTIRVAFQKKKISLESAEKIASVFDKNVNVLFDLVTLGNKKGLSEKSINHYHTFLHAVLEQAKKEGMSYYNVADSATPPKVKKHDAGFFEIEEIIRIREALNKAPSKYRVAVCILIDTGIRRGELFGIRWKSVDLKNGTITINNNIQWAKGVGLYANSPKSNDVRVVNIAPEVVEVLKEYRKEQQKFRLMLGIPDYNKEDYLFIQDNGNVMNPSSLNHWMRKFEKRYQLPHIHPHKFRHSQASILYAGGVDIVTISNRLGHAQVSTTQNIYAHIMKESDKKASDAIANILYRNQA